MTRLDFDELIKYQRFLQKALKKEQRLDNKIELLSIINRLTAGPRNIVQKEQIMIEAVAAGFREEDVEKLLEQLIREKIIYESTPGYIKKR
ncbi:hypothetical protein JW930_06280 [Candidatus Woesearchaeota archaeon]|nr:hypothetical protein [Candidatus Woesearchaeota archaeon]